MSDSFSNLVHRPTIDQFTEGVASKMSSPAWMLSGSRPRKGRRKKLFILVFPRRLCFGRMPGTQVSLANGLWRKG